MPQISKKKRSKISEQVISYLYSISPNSAFTSTIADEIVRDEEFTKSILKELEGSKILVKITKGPSGQDYKRWERWRLSNSAFEAYKKIA